MGPKERVSRLLRQLLRNTARRFAFSTHGEAKTNALNRTAVFILSSPHSGSTWTGYVLGSNPESAFVGEYHRAWKDALRVPCTLCAARGLESCEVLGDIEKEPAERAFDLAFARTGKRVVVDASKDVEWIRLFKANDGVDIRIVHLVRDPRGFFASVKRRPSRPQRGDGSVAQGKRGVSQFHCRVWSEQRHGGLRSACTVAGNRVPPLVRVLRHDIYKRMSKLLECRTSWICCKWG